MHWLPVLIALGINLPHGAGLRSVIEARPCTTELEALRFVSTPQGSRLPLYWDLKLTSYLTQAYQRSQPLGSALAGQVVIPLYAADTLIFRRGAYLFVTTGLLAQINDDAELVHQFEEFVPLAEKRLRRREAPEPSTCGPVLAAKPVVFESVWSSLHESLLRYEEWTRLRLKVRPSNPAPAATDTENSPRLY